MNITRGIAFSECLHPKKNLVIPASTLHEVILSSAIHLRTRPIGSFHDGGTEDKPCDVFLSHHGVRAARDNITETLE